MAGKFPWKLQFDELDYFNLPPRRTIAAHAIYELLLQAWCPKGKSPKNHKAREFFVKELLHPNDPTILDALTYEVLRLHAVHQARYIGRDISGKGLPTNKRRLSYNVDPKILKVFQTDELFDQIVDAISAHGHNSGDVEALWSIRKTLCKKNLPVRREANSKSIGSLGTEMKSIPDDVNPRKTDAFYKLNFFFRWCLVFASSGTKLSRETALKKYAEFKAHLNEAEAKAERATRPLIRLINEAMPPAASREISSINKRLAEFPRPWALTFIHFDYANLIRWEAFQDYKRLPFIVRYTTDVLGVHILKALFAKNWTSWRDPRWAQYLVHKIGRGAHVLREIDPTDQVTQPTLIKGRKYAFRYMADLHPRILNEQGTILLRHEYPLHAEKSALPDS